MAYRIVDHTRGKRSGYLSLLLDGKRVCDFFPFAAHTDEAFVRQQAALIEKTMNASPSLPESPIDG
jgi:hypothetical protein